MLRGKGDYRIERWSAGGVPLACVRPPETPAPAPVVIVYHRFSGRNTDEMPRLALPLAAPGGGPAPGDPGPGAGRNRLPPLLRPQHGRDAPPRPPPGRLGRRRHPPRGRP